MRFITQLGTWDILLLVTVSLQSTLVAYLYQPRWKALVFTLPIPFTFSVLAVGRPIDASNVIAFIVLLVFANLVRWLHCGLRVPIVPSIVAAAVVFCLIGMALRPWIPRSGLAFWLACAITFTLAGVVYRAMPHKAERGYRTPLPVWIKLPIITMVILFLIAIKRSLGGFMTGFPMVGVTTVYEGRYSLWTICRQVPVLTVAIGSLIVVTYLLQDRLGLGGALACGWIFFLIFSSLLTRWLWRADGLKQCSSMDSGGSRSVEPNG